MKIRNKEVMSIVAIALAAQTMMFNNAYATGNQINEDKIVGTNRYETAIEVSKKGWPNGATNAVLVNDNSISDAISATPFANAKDAPILLTNKDTLNEETKQQLKDLGVKNVYIIGGENVVSNKIEEQLISENITVDRIQGSNRQATSIEIAKRLDQINNVKEVSVVNGYKGLADAVSIASISANENMPIILSETDKISDEAIEFIDDNNIAKSYIVGGESVVSNDLENKLPNSTRIAGNNRKETNAQVINTFFTEKEINNLYVAKDGMQDESQLIDALAVGTLAAKTDSPVMIVGNVLDKSQKDLINSKQFKAITQIGGNGNETAFDEIKDIQNEIIESNPSNPDDDNPVYPEDMKLHNSKEGNNTMGFGDTTYDALKSYNWKVESDNTLVARSNDIKFENLEGNDNKDAKITLKPGYTNIIKDVKSVLTLMNGEESTYSVEDLLKAIKNGSNTIQDGTRLIEIEYKGDIIEQTITVTFSNFGVAKVYNEHEASEGTNQLGFGDTTYEELKAFGWNANVNGTEISSKDGNILFTNVNGAGNVDATIDMTGRFDKTNEDLLDVFSFMLNSRYEAERLADTIQTDYDKGNVMMIISGRYSSIKVDVKSQDSIKITFNNIPQTTQGTN